MVTDIAILPPETDLTKFDEADLDALRKAVATLEHSSLAARFSSVLGRQVDLAAQFVPEPVLAVANRATMAALRVALRAAVKSLPATGKTTPSNRAHMAYVALSGAAGGTLGLMSLPVELPISTTIMLRSIADIARSEGEDLTQPEARLACLEVFALGSGGETGPAGESGYLAMRALLAKSVSEAARFMIQRGVADETAPVMVKLLTQIAARFGIIVGQKAMAQAVPVLGALTGAAVNAAFADHFQALAQAHFTVRRLERRYGQEPVQDVFTRMRQALRDKRSGSSDAGRAPMQVLSDLRKKI
ncbi:EcsC family protein [Lichenihabitans psoromatis]|uniref:EcsC family protein n=1 Tax=Lichenihabitans psoromatis TaxID=2528642 RepID=UPI0010385151|nr:EcsC family protein [Lichenihabitans psoromatis]